MEELVCARMIFFSHWPALFFFTVKALQEFFSQTFPPPPLKKKSQTVRSLININIKITAQKLDKILKSSKSKRFQYKSHHQEISKYYY